MSYENKEASRNKNLLQKSHQKDTYMGCTPCKILGTILIVDEGRTSTNGPEGKKTMTMHRALHPIDDVDR